MRGRDWNGPATRQNQELQYPRGAAVTVPEWANPGDVEVGVNRLGQREGELDIGVISSRTNAGPFSQSVAQAGKRYPPLERPGKSRRQQTRS